MYACSFSSTASIRARHASTSSTGDTSLADTSRAASVRLNSSRSSCSAIALLPWLGGGGGGEDGDRRHLPGLLVGELPAELVGCGEPLPELAGDQRQPVGREGQVRGAGEGGDAVLVDRSGGVHLLGSSWVVCGGTELPGRQTRGTRAAVRGR